MATKMFTQRWAIVLEDKQEMKGDLFDSKDMHVLLEERITDEVDGIRVVSVKKEK